VPAVENIGGVSYLNFKRLQKKGKTYLNCVKVILAQPRGNKFVQELNKRNGVYEVDTVHPDGRVQTTCHKVG